MVTLPDGDTNVVEFVHPIQIATGRSRKAAAVVILTQLRHILARCELKPSMWGGWAADVEQGDLSISFHRVQTGTCFRIDGRAGGPPLMSGYIDPRPAGKYADGKLHVMSWKRGWESSLF